MRIDTLKHTLNNAMGMVARRTAGIFYSTRAMFLDPLGLAGMDIELEPADMPG